MTSGMDARAHGRTAAAVRALFLCVCASGASVRLAAQCPDGSPPPCGSRGAPRAPAANSVAVLEFANGAGDTSLAWLGGALAEEVATQLGEARGVTVRGAGIVRNAQRVAGTDARRVGQLVAVRYIVEGSFRGAGGSVRVSARLIELPAGVQRWGHVYDRRRDILATISDEIAHDLAAALGAPIASHQALRPPDARAYEAYQRGRFFFVRNDFETARHLFEEAVGRDSTIAPAWAGLALVWAEIADQWVAPLVAYPRAREAASRALALDSNLAAAYLPLVYAAIALDRDCQLAERLSNRAIALDSALPDARVVRSQALMCRGRGSDILAASRRAWELDTLSAYALGYWFTNMDFLEPDSLAGLFARLGSRLDEQTRALYQARAARRVGDCAAAEQMWGRAEHNNWFGWANVESLLCLGRPAAADSVVRAMIGDSARRYVNPVGVARSLATLGDRDGALRWLERGVDEHTSWVMMLHLDPAFTAMRGDPRFRALLRRLGLPTPEEVQR